MWERRARERQMLSGKERVRGMYRKRARVQEARATEIEQWKWRAYKRDGTKEGE